MNKVKIGDYKISDLYAGSYNSLDSGYGTASLNYGTSIGDIGIPTDPRVATIAKEFTDKLPLDKKMSRYLWLCQKLQKAFLRKS